MELNYDDMVMLDAEALAEGGIKEAYDSLLPRLRKYVAKPLGVVERIDDQTPSYAVVAGGTEYVIYGLGLPESEEDNAWGRATAIFFSIVNQQLTASEYRLHAISGGNDLGGMFLTEREAEEARRALPNRTDWPYIPSGSPPWYGQFH